MNMKLIIPGMPIAKARPKFCRRGMHLQPYDPQDDIKKNIKNSLYEFIHQKIHEDAQFSYEFYKINEAQALIIHFDFFFPVMSTKKISPWFLDYHIYKPDLDNLDKFYLDILSKEIFPDDKQVVELSSKKFFSKKPRTEINIMIKKKIPLHDKVKSVLDIFDPTSLEEFYEDVETLKVLVKGIDFENLDNVKPEWITSTSCFLSKFSHKYSTKLGKIKKIGNLSEEMNNFQSIQEVNV
jgi:Holliday junction resolvase RusA-like endonuclease